jgi:hypothetical protein
LVGRLKALDPERPIREADIPGCSRTRDQVAIHVGMMN